MPKAISGLSVMFFERINTRVVENAADLCKTLNAIGIHTQIFVETQILCNELSVLIAADVVVVMTGSHAQKLALLRTGTWVSCINLLASLLSYQFL